MASPFVYKHEPTLFWIATILSICLWALILIASLGTLLIIIPLLFIVYLFAQSALICYLKGTGTLVTTDQFEDIHDRVISCAKTLRLNPVPRVYILHGNGIFNAFATRFLRRNYIVILSDVLDALEDDPQSINFYIGHEMGHIIRRHVLVEPFISPALILPLLGAAYSRAREYTCDLHGAACCDLNAAQKALIVLSVGGKRYKTINLQRYLKQAYETRGFWMSFHELVSSYPWLVKRVAHISRLKTTSSGKSMFARNPFAYIFAAFIPRLNIFSLFLIYFVVGLTIGGILKGQALIEKARERAEHKQAQSTEYLHQPKVNEATRQVTAIQKPPFIVEKFIEGSQKSLPMRVDEITVLKDISWESPDKIIYNYKIDADSSAINPTNLIETLQTPIMNYWCQTENRNLLVVLKSQIIYRYKDRSGDNIGGFPVLVSHCP